MEYSGSVCSERTCYMTADVQFEELKQELFYYILLWKRDGSVLIEPSFVFADHCS